MNYSSDELEQNPLMIVKSIVRMHAMINNDGSMTGIMDDSIIEESKAEGNDGEVDRD